MVGTTWRITKSNGHQNISTKFICLFTKYYLSTYDVPVINLGSNDTVVNKTKTRLPHAIHPVQKDK